jgi:hypothetical protein
MLEIAVKEIQERIKIAFIEEKKKFSLNETEAQQTSIQEGPSLLINCSSLGTLRSEAFKFVNG